MIGLCEKKGRVLEPSCGNGSFLKKLDKDAVAIEIEKSLCNEDRMIHQDFFDYPISEKFETVIGNPPYVRYQDISQETKGKLKLDIFDKRSNLYLFFIEKSLKHLKDQGEIVFITPRDFLKLTSAKRLNETLYRQGSFTHFLDLGDRKIFDGFSPNCAIWRWQKGKTSKRLDDGRRFCFKNGQIWFGDLSHGSHGLLGDQFSIKVGAVSGADSIFTNEEFGCRDFVCSHTAVTEKTRRMIYNTRSRFLEPYKKTLMNRRIKNFNNNNWWQWGRAYPEKDAPRIYVNCKTRNPKPFFTHPSTAYDGSVLALFPKSDFDLEEKVERLNRIDWAKLGFVCDGRHIFSQRSLENAAVEV